MTPSHRDVAKEIFKKKNLPQVKKKYGEDSVNLKNVAEKPVWDYFDNNLNGIKEE